MSDGYPASDSKTLGLWLDGARVKEAPVIGWRDFGDHVQAVTLFGMTMTVERSGVVYDMCHQCVWRSRADWVEDLTECGIQGILPTQEWVDERSRQREAQERSKKIEAGGWPVGTKAKAEDLDRLGVPLDASRPVAMQALRDAGVLPPGKLLVIQAALRYRRTHHS